MGSRSKARGHPTGQHILISCLPQVPPALLVTFNSGLQERSCKVLQHALSLIHVVCLMLAVHPMEAVQGHREMT